MLPLLMFNVIAETIKDNLKGLMNLPNSQSDSSSSVYFVNFNQDCTFIERGEKARMIGLMAVLFIFLTFPLSLCVHFPCPFYFYSIVKDNCAGCGMCQTDASTDKTMCFYDQDNYFLEGENCDSVLYCKRTENLKKCKGLKCQSMLGAFRCVCGSNSFGQFCQYNRIEGSSPSDYALVDDIIFTPIVTYGKYLTLTLILSNIGKNLVVSVDTIFEQMYYDSDMCKEVSKIVLCRTWFNDYPNLCKSNANIKNHIVCAITLHFVFISSSYEKVIKIPKIHGDYRSMVIGVIHNITVKIYNNLHNKLSYPVFENVYKVSSLFYSPTLHSCQPYLTVRNGDESMRNATTFTIRDKIVLRSSYKLLARPDCDNVDNVMLHWTVWKIYTNHDDLLTIPLKELFQEVNLVFPAYSLSEGVYKAKLNVSVWKGLKESFKFHHSYFKVIELKPVPVILGGVERSAYYDVESLTFVGSLSRNPNVLPSKQQGSLKFYWKCDKPDDFCKLKRSDYSITYRGPFKKNENYTFYLTVVSAGGKQKQATTSQRVLMIPVKQDSIEVLCKKNCGGSDDESDTGNIIYLVAGIVGNASASQDDNEYDWTYTIARENNYISVDRIRQGYTPDNVLIVLKNSLIEGEIYSFQVKCKSINVSGAKFIIKMASKVPAFSCSTDISLGNNTILRGVTKLKVVCDKLKYNKLAPIYDFYDRHVGVEDDNGRLIVSGKSNVAFDVVITRGNLVVEVTNEYGKRGVSELIVKLQHTTNVTDIVREEIENLKKNGSTSDAEFRINTISIILDLVANETNKITDYSAIIEYMLNIACEDEISNIPILKMWTSVVNTIAKEDVIGKFTTKSINYLSKVVRKLSKELLFQIREGINKTKSNDLTNEEVNRLCRTMLKICNAISNISSEDLIKRKLSEGDSYSLHVSYRESSGFLVRAVGQIMLSLALTLQPYQSPVFIKEHSISVWVKQDTPESFSITKNDSLTSVVISKSLAESIRLTSNIVIVQVAEYVNNPYWYSSEFDIHTQVVDLQVRFKKEGIIPFIDEILQPIVINLQHLETDSRVLNGSVCQPYSNKSRDLADLAVAVHKIRVPQTGRMNLRFLDLEEDDMIRVKVLFNLRPDYDLMTDKDVRQITKSSPTLRVDLKDPHSHNVYDLYYIGILPGMNIPEGHCLRYSFEMSALHCVTWKSHEWSTRGCRVKGTINSQQLQCECEHLSTFAGFSQVPINTIDPISDYTLFLSLTENPFVLIFLAFLMSVYFILLIWALRKDKKGKIKERAIYLEDNFPGDPFPYLIAVYTGSRFFSGTTSNVGIMIEGEDAGSRAHLLKSSAHRLLERGDDSWFIILTPYHLGDLTMIHLWMDFSGKSPEWYCHKVMVVDLLTCKEYQFLVDTWMSLKGDDFIERFVEVSESHAQNHINMTIDNMILGFRETHLWFSVLTRHPRSSVTRAQRLSLAFTGLLITMLVSCMFYGVLGQRREDNNSFSFSMKESIIAITSLVISAILINIVVSFFRRSFVVTQSVEDIMLEGEEKDDDLDEKKSKTKRNEKLKKNMFLLRFFEDVLKVVTKPKKFKPVLLDIDEIKVNLKKKLCDVCWLLLSWSICISMICVCSYLIVLYGLKFGKVKSLEWLSSVVLSLLQVVFLVAPLRIISIAAVSGLLSSNMFKVVSYHIQPQLLEKCKLWQLNSDPNLDSKLIKIRSQQFYIPLSYKEVTKKFYKQKRKVATWLLLDMVLIFVLLVLMFLQNESLWSTKYYRNNQQLSSLLRQSYEAEGFQSYSLPNFSHYSRFLRRDVFPVIYQSKWYNGLSIIEQNATTDFRFVFGGTSKLVGLPRLRQIRLQPDLCEKPIYENLSQFCNVKLTEDTEDRNLYAEGWVETGPREKFPKLSPWNHMSDSETYDTTLFGYSNTAYKGDGYVAELDMTEEKAEDIVLTLHREKWLDRRTCVVIFELTLYNAFSGTFSWVIFVTENLHIGLLMNRVYVFTVSDSYEYPVFDIVCFLALLMFTIRVFFVVNRNGFDKLVHNRRNIFEVIIVVLAITCAVLFMLNIYLRSDYLKAFMNGDDKEKYFQYFHLLEYLDEFRIVLSFLMFFLVCRFIMSFRFGKIFTVYFDSVVFDWNRIIWIFMVITLFLYTHWRLFSYLMNNYTLSKNNFLIISKVDFKLIVENCSNVQCKIIPFVLCSVSYFLQLIIISHLVFTYRIVKRKSSEKELLNFCTVFCEKYDFPIVMKDPGKRKSRIVKLT